MPDNRSFYLPAAVDRTPGAWTSEESILDKASVDRTRRTAKVPAPYTPAKKLARYHELYHARHSPQSWEKTTLDIMQQGVERSIPLDFTTTLKIAKMLEETRVDWRLWKNLGIDMRPCRESLNWAAFTIPDNDLIEATAWVLQLAWSVWGSTGLWVDDIPDTPEVRESKPALSDFHSGCWTYVQSTNPELATDIIRGLTLLLTTPTHSMRDKITLELARYFPPKTDYDQPEADEEEQELEAEIQKMLEDEEEQKKEDDSGGDFNGVDDMGTWELHDHTRGPRRPRVVVKKRWAPKPEGTIFKYPHRHMLDRMVFGRKSRQTGSILVDNSGSMKWKNKDMMFLLDHMPNLWIGGYEGHTILDKPRIQGRLCIFAKNGVFNVYTGREPTGNGGNAIDLEALRYLGTQPEPRFWLSDGLVIDGQHGGPHPVYDVPSLTTGEYFRTWGKLIDLVNKTMRQYRILRVPDKETMVQLVQRHRVRLFQSTRADKLLTTSGRYLSGDLLYPPEVPLLPTHYQL